jgi:hypothetical protein
VTAVTPVQKWPSTDRIEAESGSVVLIEVIRSPSSVVRSQPADRSR